MVALNAEDKKKLTVYNTNRLSGRATIQVVFKPAWTTKEAAPSSNDVHFC